LLPSLGLQASTSEINGTIPTRVITVVMMSILFVVSTSAVTVVLEMRAYHSKHFGVPTSIPRLHLIKGNCVTGS
jgi:hypothetical protein